MDTTRRRSPGWLRQCESREIHGIAFHLNLERQQDVLSNAQEWLFDACISELEYRRDRARWPDRRCSCELCLGPFEP